MRILMVIENGSDMNPYVSSLVSGLTECGHEVVCSLTLFWDCVEKYDLLYFQWPEAVFDWRKNEIDIDKLSKHFKRIKETGIKTLITCHNLHPHNNDTKTTELYNTIYAKVDAFHHMGRFSYEFMKKKYPDRHHFIAPHHVSDSLWLNPVCLSEAKAKFRIPKSNIVVSSFGAFRNTDEVWLFVNMAKDINDRNLSFFAPRIPKGRFYNGFNVKRTINYLY